MEERGISKMLEGSGPGGGPGRRSTSGDPASLGYVGGFEEVGGSERVRRGEGGREEASELGSAGRAAGLGERQEVSGGGEGPN